MIRDGDEVHLSEDEARSGSTPNIVRYVLAISLVLAIVLLSAIWIVGASRAPQGDHTAPITNQAPPTGAAR
jgi:hypothetical protein